MTGLDAAKALPHVGHRIECVTYGRPGKPENVAVECVDCSEVIADADVPDRPKSLENLTDRLFREERNARRWEDA